MTTDAKNPKPFSDTSPSIDTNILYIYIYPCLYLYRFLNIIHLYIIYIYLYYISILYVYIIYLYYISIYIISIYIYKYLYLNLLLLFSIITIIIIIIFFTQFLLPKMVHFYPAQCCHFVRQDSPQRPEKLRSTRVPLPDTLSPQADEQAWKQKPRNCRLSLLS